MADQFKEDKTEKPTGKRRSQARNDGNVAYSQEVGLVCMVMGSILGLYCVGGSMRTRMIILMRDMFSKMNDPFSSKDLVALVLSIVISTFKILFPMLCIILVISYVSSWIQVGNLFTFKPLSPKLSKIKPKIGSLNIFKKDQIVKLGVSLGKLIIVLPVAYFTVSGSMTDIMMIFHKTVPEIFQFICMIIFKMSFRISLVLIILAILDYVHKYFKREKDLKMTKQEVKDEMKNMDQDPQIKSRIKSYGREIMRKLMFDEVPTADVVITNPTHIAVAIKYDQTTMDAPRVVAKGMRLIAERIKAVARENNVPVVENKPLARLIYKTVDVGGEIPPELYKAIAEILAYVYKMNSKKSVGYSLV